MSFYSTCNCGCNTGCNSGCCNCAFSPYICQNYFTSCRPLIQRSALPIARENFEFPTNQFAYYTNASAVVDSDTIIPMATFVNNNVIDMVNPNSNDTFTLSAGTYRINYGSNITNNTGGSVLANLSLDVNNLSVDTVTQTIPTTETANVNGEAIITVPNGAILSLQNTSGNTLTFINTYISITPIN